MIKTKKQLILIIASVIFFLVLLSAGILIYNSLRKRQVVAEQKSWDVSSQEALIKNGLSEFLTINKDESSVERVKRLENYFISPNELNYSPEYEGIVLKTSATIGGISGCEEQEGGDLCVVANAIVVFVTDNGRETQEQRYWVTIDKDQSNKFKIKKIGLIE